MDRYKGLRGLSRRHFYFMFGCMLLTALILAMMGRSWWCPVGDWSLWAGGAQSRHNSQHLADPYTLTHILHGLGFYLLLWLGLRKRSSGGTRFAVAMVLESAWEVLENSDPIIEKYRADTIALGYFGDSIVNSMSDIVACAAGYLLAAVLPIVGSVLLFLLIEALLIWWIRDSLLLNILMLLWPMESIRKWQLASLLGSKSSFAVLRRREGRASTTSRGEGRGARGEGRGEGGEVPVHANSFLELDALSQGTGKYKSSFTSSNSIPGDRVTADHEPMGARVLIVALILHGQASDG